MIQKQVVFRGEIFLWEDRCCWGEGTGFSWILRFWGGSSPLTPRLGKISGEKHQSLGMNWCLFWWCIYSG